MFVPCLAFQMFELKGEIVRKNVVMNMQSFPHREGARWSTSLLFMSASLLKQQKLLKLSSYPA